jgi:hypothetical protein
MSNTEIYVFVKKRNKPILIGAAKNSWRGSISVWDALNEKYSDKCTINHGYDDLWKLMLDKRLTRNEKIVLNSTFDEAICKIENAQELIDALRDVHHNLLNDNSNLDVQADIIERSVKERKDILAFKILGTSVCSIDEIIKNIEYGFDIIEDLEQINELNNKEKAE